MDIAPSNRPPPKVRSRPWLHAGDATTSVELSPARARADLTASA